MQPVAALVLGVMSRVGRRAARSRTSWTISSREADVPMASGQMRCRPPLVERSVTMTPPHWVIQEAAVARSACGGRAVRPLGVEVERQQVGSALGV